MTTGPDGVMHVAVITGSPVTAVERVAKLLKQANPPMWARSPQGGGHKAEHLRSTHLTNIVLALAMAVPASRAVETVGAYRELYPKRSLAAVLGRVEFRSPWGETASLGAGLDRTMEVFRDPTKRAVREHWRSLDFHVILEADPPRAMVRFLGDPALDTEYRGDGYEVEPGENPQAPKLPRTFMQRPVILTCEMFEALADLLEAPAEEADGSKVSSQGVPGPEKENAGLPGPASLADDTSLPGPVPLINNASLFDTTFGRQDAHTSGANTRERSVRDPLPSRGLENMAGHLSRSWPNASPPQHP